jgi:hypothetical protein
MAENNRAKPPISYNNHRRKSMVQTASTSEQPATLSPRNCHCEAQPKWAALVNDVVIPAPQRQVPATVLRAQAAINDDLALVRDHNSPYDVVIDDSANVDLADGNVFYTVSREEAAGRGGCHSPPKLAYFVDDHAEVTTNPDQNGRTIRELFGLDVASRLVRDFESPVDEPVGLEESAVFGDGPVFYTRQVTPTVIIVNGKRRRVTGPQLTFEELVQLAFDPPPTGEFICFTITYRGGPCSNPEGSLLEGQSVTIADGMVFNVTATDKS